MSLAEEVAQLLPQGLITGYVGVVKAVSDSGAATVDVRGADLPVSCNAGYYPVVGDNVLLMRVDNSNSWVVAFKIASPSGPALGKWKDMTLINGWKPYGNGWQVPGYRKLADGTVQLRGLADGTSKTSGVMFQMPVGFRPSGGTIFPTVNNNAFTRIDIGVDGAINQTVGTASWNSLDGIFFAAA